MLCIRHSKTLEGDQNLGQLDTYGDHMDSGEVGLNDVHFDRTSVLDDSWLPELHEHNELEGLRAKLQ